MNTPASSLELLRHALTSPTRGVLGLVDELLAVSGEQGLLLDWKADHCRVQLREGGPASLIEVPLRKSVVRAALARVAVLCNQHNPNSVSPYGGQGELLIGTNPIKTVRAAFVNTPDEQSLELTPVHKEGMPALPEATFDGQTPKRPGDLTWRQKRILIDVRRPAARE